MKIKSYTKTIKRLRQRLMNSFPDLLDFNNTFDDLVRVLTNMQSKKIVKGQIEECMLSFYNNLLNRENIRERLDELFLLWSKITNKSFMESVEEFGIDYCDFDTKNYNKIAEQICIKLKPYENYY
jgi:ribosomal protein S17E